MLFMSSIQKAPSFFSKVFLAMLPRRRLVYWALGLPLLLMAGYLFVHYYVTPLRHIPWSRVHLLAAPLGELLLIFFLFDLYHRTKGRAWSNGFVFLFAFFLVNFVAALFLMAYYGTVTPDVPAVSKILLAAPFVLTALFTGTVVSFVIGFRPQLRRAWLDYSLGSRDGDEESDKKGKILTASALIGFFILGLALRLHNLDGFPPYVGEYIHTNWAFLVYSGQPAEWGRAFLTVNLPVYLSYLTFGVNLWAGRFPMVLINMLSNPRTPGRIRYGILMEYWYLPLVALFLWAAYDLGRKLLPKAGQVIVAALLVVLFTNPLSVWYAINYQGGPSMRLTGENHYIAAPAHEFLASRLTEQDVLLSDFMQAYDNIHGQRFRLRENFTYYKMVFGEQVSPLTIIEEYPQGWVAVSANARPANYGLVLEDFTHAGKNVRYIERQGDIYLWQWGDNAGQ